MFEYYYNSLAKLGNIEKIIRQALDKYGKNLELPCYISVNHLGDELADIYVKRGFEFKVKYISFEECILSGFEPF